MSITNNYPATRPTLLLDFARSKKLDPRITFTRASTGTYYNGDTEAKAEENLLLQSQTFNTTWLVVNSTVTVDSTAAPDGTSTADTITDNATLSGHDVVQPITISANTTYSYSIFVKAGTSNYCIVAVRDGATGNRYFGSVFDLSTVSASQTFNGTSGTLTSTSITSAGNGWYRCSVIGSVSAVGSMRVSIGIAPAASGNTISNFGALSYVGTGSTIYAWGAQLEQRSAVTSYTATTIQPITNYIPVLLTAQNNVARFNHNPVTEESLGLLIEEQRTNLVTYSDDFSNAAWILQNLSGSASKGASNIIVAPNGTQTGDEFISGGSSGVWDGLGSSNVSVANDSAAYTTSYYVKAGSVTSIRVRLRFTGGTTADGAVYFNLSTGVISSQESGRTGTITSVGNNWYRLTVTGANNSTGNTICQTYIYANQQAGNFYIWGAQLEAGSFPTSYIPTTSSQATRAADVASMTGSNFSSWYNPAEGTIYSQFIRNGISSVAQYAFAISDNTGNNVIRSLVAAPSINRVLEVVTNNSNQVMLDIGSAPAVGVTVKYSSAYKVNDFAAAVDGGTPSTDTSGTLPIVNRIYIGSSQDGTLRRLNGTISKIAYYPVRCTNAQLQALTGS